MSSMASSPTNEPLEPRIAPQRIEGGIDLQPPAREIVRHLEQRLEAIERLLRLVREDIDPHELVLKVRTEVRIARDRPQRDRALTFPFRLDVAAKIGERQGEV